MIAFLADGIRQALGRGLETGAQQGPGRAQRERRGYASPVCDPAGRQDRYRRSQIRYSRHERQRGPAAAGAVPAGLGALRHDDVGTEIHRLPSLLHVSDLDDQHRACLPDEPGERARITERQHHRMGAVLQRPLHCTRADRPAQEADAPRVAGAVGDERQLAVKPGQVPDATAQQSQPAAIRNRRRERAASRPAHRRQRDRVPDAKQPGERRGQHHS